MSLRTIGTGALHLMAALEVHRSAGSVMVDELGLDSILLLLQLPQVRAGLW